MGGSHHNCSQCGTEIAVGVNFCPTCGREAKALDVADPLIGRCIANKYVIEHLLGSGAMGCIYRGQHTALDRRVAIKVLHSHLVDNENMVLRFMREARAASRLSHPNIVTLLDFGQDGVDGLLYLVMEYLEGRSLQVIMDSESPLGFRRAFNLSRQILSALDEAHDLGVVHRDLKPDNIIVTLSRRKVETVKVVDFGLAQVLGGDDVKLTAPGLICGTPTYISPEQARSPEVGPPSDIYSFGVILYEMITGKLPFSAQSSYAMVAKHLTEPAPHPAERAPERGVPEALAQTMLRCLEKEPDERFPDAMALLDALSEVIGPQGSQEMAPVQPRPVTGPQPPVAPVQVEERRCPSCGNVMPSSSNFCGECGHRLITTAELAATTEPETKELATARPLVLRGRTPSAEVILFGRVREHEVIKQAARRALEGQGSALLISGEPGIGRTTLLLLAADTLAQVGLRIHMIRATPRGKGLSCTGLLLRSLLGCTAAAEDAEVHQRLAKLEALGLDTTDREALRYLTSVQLDSSGLAPGSLALACSIAMRRLLKATASVHPTAILIDDAYNLASWERLMLDPAAAATKDQALMLVVTDTSRGLASWPHRSLSTLELGPLDLVSAQRLLTKLTGDRDLHPEVSRSIVETTGGNPLFMVETVSLLEEQGKLEVGDPQSAKIPGGIRSLVNLRLRLLTDRQKRTLYQACVLGRSFTLDMISELSSNDPQLPETIDALCRAGMIERLAGSGPPRLEFSHEVLRHMVYEQLSRKEKRTLHDEVANLLLTTHSGSTTSGEVGHHLEQAARHAEASDMFERAGSEHGVQHDPAEVALVLDRAVAALERSLTVHNGGQRTSNQRIMNLKIKLAEAQNEAGQWDKAKPVALEARNAALQSGEVLLAARASKQLALAAADQGDLALADSVLSEAHQAALECGDLDLALELAAELGDLRERAGQLQRALTTLEDAFERLQSTSRRAKSSQKILASRIAEVLNRLGRVSLRAERIDDALRYLQEALKQAQASGDPEILARVLSNLGNALAISGDLATAYATLSTALQTLRETGDRIGIAKMLHNMACLQLSIGERDQAEVLARESLQLSAEIGWGEGEELSTTLLEQLAG
jgi:serine/threonine-protein kinase